MRTLIFFLLPALAVCAEVRADLRPPNQRTAAPDFALQDAAGKTVRLKDYRGKLLVIDFWATWCHGCKEEIPWFAELAGKYRGQGLQIVGVSLDEQGWKVLNPFLAGARIPYTILLGADEIAQRYGIESMPDTFLIDQKGRLAASYTGGLVDKQNLEANVRALLKMK